MKGKKEDRIMTEEREDQSHTQKYSLDMYMLKLVKDLVPYSNIHSQKDCFWVSLWILGRSFTNNKLLHSTFAHKRALLIGINLYNHRSSNPITFIFTIK